MAPWLFHYEFGEAIMEKKAMYSGVMAGLEQVNLSARTRTHVESQVRFAAMIVEMIIGKAPAQGAAKDASITH
jgi:hypothetical protein